jgi:hypothetical protein
MARPAASKTSPYFKLLPMDATLTALAAAPRERLAIIADEESRHDREQHTARLREVSEKIERLEQSLPQKIDPELRHFLQCQLSSFSLPHGSWPRHLVTRRTQLRLLERQTMTQSLQIELLKL